MELRRGVDPVLLAALAQVSYPVLFVYLDWPGSPLRLHTGVGSIVWGGNEWLGVGTLGNIEVPAESGGVAATDAVVSMAGLPEEIENWAGDSIRGRVAEVCIGALTERPGGHDGMQNGSLIGVPARLFSGLMDGFTITTELTDMGVSQTASVSIITGVEARASSSAYHNDEDQQRWYPGDTAGRHVVFAIARAEKLRWPEN